MAKLLDFGAENPGPRGGRVYSFLCPGCGYGHPFEIPHWTWNGSFDKPTFSPSLLCNQHDAASRCHCFVREGRIEFLSDCFHQFAGQTVDMVEYGSDAPP